MDTAPTRSRVAKVFEVVGRAGFGAPIPSPGASLLTAPNGMGSKDSADAEQTPMTVAAAGTPHSDQDGDHQGHEWNRAAFASDHHLVSRTMGATNPMIHDAIVTNALQLCLLGNYADAVAELDALPPGYANGASLVQGLMARARLFAGRRRVPPPRRLPTATNLLRRNWGTAAQTDPKNHRNIPCIHVSCAPARAFTHRCTHSPAMLYSRRVSPSPVFRIPSQCLTDVDSD
jgi:hypothetical protein